MNNSAYECDSNFLTLQEASDATGLSEQTLNRFAQAEYFKSKSDNNKLLIDRAELFSVLNIKDTKKNRITSHKAIQPQTTQHQTLKSTATDQEASLTETTATDAQPTVDDATQKKTHIDVSFEIEKLKAVAELHEKFIELKEKEILGLTNERDWLRARIEKLEEKNDRDQLIMASMSETQRTFASQINNKKSSLQLALEWLGVAPQPPSKTEQ